MRKQRLHREIIYGITSLLKGLGVTFVNVWRKKVTLMYPEKRWELPEGYRGMPALPVGEDRRFLAIRQGAHQRGVGCRKESN